MSSLSLRETIASKLERWGLHDRARAAAMRQRLSRTRLRVQLVVTPICSGMAYHSSVLVGKTEYSFSPDGVAKVRGPWSHRTLEAETTYMDFGVRSVSVKAFEAALFPHFAPGSYDLLRKNCNSFADMAIFFLTGQRLDSKYTQAEAVGMAADSWTGGLVQALSVGLYVPNPRAERFDADRLAARLAASEPECQANWGARRARRCLEAADANPRRSASRTGLRA